MKRPSLQRQRGVSLVEVAIASVILGACGVLLWNVIDSQAKVASADRSISTMDRVHDAILAYAYLHRELPCPALVTTGLESCDGNTEGYVPYLTLGLPEPAAGHIRYRMALDVRSPTASSPYRVVTGLRSGEFDDLSAQLVPLAAVAPDGHEELFDLCQALGSPARSGEIAYALGLDNAIAVPVAAGAGAPSAPALAPAAVMDQVVGRAQFAAKLQCGSLAVAGRAHFNAALAADTMSRAIADMVAQLALVEFTYSVDLAQGVYFEANSFHSLYRANMKRLGALAASEATNGVDSAALTVAEVRTALAGTYTAALALNVARFAINLHNAGIRKQTLKDLRTETERAAAEIKARAVIGSSSAFFLEDKWSPPKP